MPGAQTEARANGVIPGELSYRAAGAGALQLLGALHSMGLIAAELQTFISYECVVFPPSVVSKMHGECRNFSCAQGEEQVWVPPKASSPAQKRQGQLIAL